MSGTPVAAEEDALRDDLARADAAIASATPVLRLLLAEGDQALFSDQVVARIRGMIHHCARQLLTALAEESANAAPDPALQAGCEALLARHHAGLSASLLQDGALLSHAQALALEALGTERLQQRAGVDPVLTPLIQDLCASADEQVATLAMQVLAAQARFIQQQRRMELPLDELPGELFHRALLVLRGCDAVAEDTAVQCERRLRSQFDDGGRRINRIARLVLMLGLQSDRALACGEAGLAIFISALAMASEQDRDLVVLSLGDNQLPRLALSLRAAGLAPAEIEQQLVQLHPDTPPPAGIADISPDRAAALLHATQARWTEAEHG